MIALAVSPVPARTMAAAPAVFPQQVCQLAGNSGDKTESEAGGQPVPPLPDLSPVRLETLTRLCQALRAALPSPAAGLYLQLTGTSPTGMTLRLVRRPDGTGQEEAGQDGAGQPLTLDTMDAPAPSDSSLRQMARLLIATLPPS